MTFALMALVAGCGIREARDSARLIGVWKLDPEAGLELRMGAAPDDQARPDSFQLTTGSARGEPDSGLAAAGDSAMTLSFLSGSKLETQTTTGPIDSKKSGSWRMVSYDSQQQTAVITCTLGQQTTEHTVEWIDADTIKLTPPNMAGVSIKLMFRREKGQLQDAVRRPSAAADQPADE